LELNAEESAKTWVGQNSTQNPHPLQRSTEMEMKPLATGETLPECGKYARLQPLQAKRSDGMKRRYFAG